MAAYRAYLSAGLSLMVVACAVQHWSESPNGSQEKKPARPASVEPPSKGSEPSAASASALGFDLSTFQPILAESSHAAAKALVESENPGGAARELWPLGVQAETREQAALAFTAGGLHLQAGQPSDAQAAYVAAAKFEGPLKADAKLRAAEVALDRGQSAPELLKEAKELLSGASALSAEPRYERARARLETALGRLGPALLAYQALCAPSCLLDDKLAFAELAARARGAGNVAEFEAVLTPLVRMLRLERARSARSGPEHQKLDSVLVKLGAKPASPADRLAELKVMVEASRAEESFKEAEALRALQPRPSGSEPALTRAERCELDLLFAKSLALNKKWGAAADVLGPRVAACSAEKELHLAMLFNLGKFAAADGRDALAIGKYAELERLYPESSLADDARLRAAHSQKDLGNVARFTELLSKMPEDYPQGDMTMEGVLELALYSAERNDWGAASLVLERGAALVRAKDSSRGTERSGAERYFWARSLHELDQVDRAIAEYEALVREVPLSYYMLHAYSRLSQLEPERAQKALESGMRAALESPFTFTASGYHEHPQFLRGLELLRVGELEEGRRVLESMGLADDERDSMLWAMALLYDRAGDARSGHQILRGRLTDWLAHYPAGPWRAAWEVGFPKPYAEIVHKESLATSVPESLIYGVMREESTFDPRAESPARAFGLMQLIEPTARMVGKPLGLRPTRESLFVPKLNIQLGARVLKELLKMFKENPALAIPGYNAGPGRPRRWLAERPSIDFDLWVELIPIRETRRYMKRVLASQAAYAFLYGPVPDGATLLLPERLSSGAPTKVASVD